MTRKQLSLFFPAAALFVWMVVMCATPPSGVTPATEADQVVEVENVQELLRKARERDKQIEKEEAERARAEPLESKIEEPTESTADPLATKAKPPHHKPETKSRGTYDPQRGVNVMTKEESRRVICEFFGECDFTDEPKKAAPVQDIKKAPPARVYPHSMSESEMLAMREPVLDRSKPERQGGTSMGGSRRSPGVVIERIPFKPRARDEELPIEW